MTWPPRVPYPGEAPFPDQQEELMRRLQVGKQPLFAYSDAEIQAEVERRREAEKQRVADAIELLRKNGYRVDEALGTVAK